MPNVTIDGITYTPASQQTNRIGIGVTTRNRPDTYQKTITEIRRHLPPGAALVIVDDASDTPNPDATHRYTTQAGIAAAKNKCLQLLAEQDVEHYFLFDDDTYPLTPNWWQPYVESPEPHLSYTFPYQGGPTPIYNDGKHTAWPHPCGCMLYLHRSVLDRVGGMDPAYGTWGHEHVDLSNRAHNAGLTAWRFADINGSGELLHCEDQKGTVRTVPRRQRDEQLKRNLPYYETQRDSDAYKEYRTQRDVVLACWQHGPDKQRGNRTSTLPAAEAAAELAKSVKGGEFILFADDSTGHVPVEPSGVPLYYSRWIHYYRWLLHAPEVRWAWLVDTNDVTMQHEPWAVMEPGVLYCGYEPAVVGIKWMFDSHPAPVMQDWIRANASRGLLNCGVVGGDRATILALLRGMVRLYEDHGSTNLGVDMGPFNKVAYGLDATLKADAQVVTLFKTGESNAWSWWRHK